MTGAPIRIMAVDDSAVIRGMWARVLDAEPDMRVVASAWTGKAALDVLRRRDVDVVLLDVEMPEMDGIEALPHILKACPGVRVIMASSLTKKGAEVTVRALSLGAADYVTKPQANSLGGSLEDVSRDLIAKIRALVPRAAQATPSPTLPGAHSRPAAGAPPTIHAAPPAVPQRFSLRPPPGRGIPRIVGITSSTGGPNALTELLGSLPADFPLPILIVQHMPPLFTTMLAERLHRAGNRPCLEVEDGMLIRHGHSYVAPGGKHMTVERRGTDDRLVLTDGPAENFCKPSADPFFRSMARLYGPDMLAVILTGMGHDGLAGARAVAEAGGSITVQDQATSVVWGMPGAVATAGLAHRVLPLAGISTFLEERVGSLR